MVHWALTSSLFVCGAFIQTETCAEMSSQHLTSYNWPADNKWPVVAYFKALVLQNLLDGHHLSCVAQFCLIDNTKRAISYHFCVSVWYFLRPIWTLARRCNNCSCLAPIFACHNKHIRQLSLKPCFHSNACSNAMYTMQLLALWTLREMQQVF